MLKKSFLKKKVRFSIITICLLFMAIFLSVLGLFSGSKNQNFEVDLVYLWCDGAEPAFQQRRVYYLEKEKKLRLSAASEGRFEQVDELKYSLRSVEKYLPWIHHIYIVTDRQVPSWLNIRHPKITVVDHSEIIPQKYLPTFNSSGIEAAIHKIPGLSEHFLLANDDTFINRRLDKNFFFKNGRPIIRMKKIKKDQTIGLYRLMLRYSVSLMERDFGLLPFFSDKNSEPHHNIDAYLKSDYTDCVTHFDKEFTETLTHRFRKKTSVHRVIVSVWSFINGHSELKLVPASYKKEHKNIDSVYMSNRVKNYLEILKSNNPGLFCINDNEKATIEDRMRVKTFLEGYFPQKSAFEL